MEQVLSTCSLLNNILIFIPHRELLLSTALVSCGWKVLSYAAVQEVRYYLMSLERVLSLIRENTYPNIRKLTLGWCAGRQEILPCSNGDNVYVILLLEWLLQDVANLPHLVELGVECIADKPDLAQTAGDRASRSLHRRQSVSVLYAALLTSCDRIAYCCDRYLFCGITYARYGIAVTALTSARPELQLLKPLSDHATALCRAPVTEPVVFYGVSTKDEEQEGDLPFDGFPGFYDRKYAHIGFKVAGDWAYLYCYSIQISSSYFNAMALRLPKEAFMQGFGCINELVCGAQYCYVHDTFTMRDSMRRLREVKDNPVGATLVHLQHEGARLFMVPPVDTEQEIAAVRAARAENLEPLEQEVVNCLNEQCGTC
eukprot:17442-Heterococcus_DN1.PRE.1